MSESIHVNITEVTIVSGKRKKLFRLEVDGKTVTIPVGEDLFAHYMDQLVRDHPSTKQKSVFATVMNLMRAAYKKGVDDGKASA